MLSSSCVRSIWCFIHLCHANVFHTHPPTHPPTQMNTNIHAHPTYPLTPTLPHAPLPDINCCHDLAYQTIVLGTTLKVLLNEMPYLHAGISFMFIDYCIVKSCCETETFVIFTIEMEFLPMIISFHEHLYE